MSIFFLVFVDTCAGGLDLRVIAVANQKGGCGKTTTSVNFSAALGLLQKKVLLIDLDPQGHVACGLGMKLTEDRPTLYELLSPLLPVVTSLDEAIVNIDSHLDVIPSHFNLSSLEEEFHFLPNQHARLRLLVERIQRERPGYDFIVLDCPPNIGALTWNGLHSSDEVLIPVEPSFFSLHGLGKISETLQKTQDLSARKVQIHALMTMYDPDMTLAQEIYDEVCAHFEDKLFKTKIHWDVQLKEAAAVGKSIIHYAPESKAFRDYLNLAVEYLERDWDRRLPKRELGWSQVLKHHYGPRVLSDGILFQFHNKGAHSVEIAGDFNHWIPEALVARSEGLWQKVIPAKGTKFRYKYIVDGEWQIDPHHEEKRDNEFGGVDSYLEIL